MILEFSEVSASQGSYSRIRVPAVVIPLPVRVHKVGESRGGSTLCYCSSSHVHELEGEMWTGERGVDATGRTSKKLQGSEATTGVFIPDVVSIGAPG